MIRNHFLPVLGSESLGKGYYASQGWLLLVPGFGLFGEYYNASLG